MGFLIGRVPPLFPDPPFSAVVAPHIVSLPPTIRAVAPIPLFAINGVFPFAANGIEDGTVWGERYAAQWVWGNGSEVKVSAFRDAGVGGGAPGFGQ